MLNFLISLVNPLGAVAEKLADAYAKQKDTQTEQERIKNDTMIKQLEMRQEILIAEQKYRLTRWIRPAFAYPIAFYLGKIFVWDKALHLGTSDPIDETLSWVMMAIVGFYFLTRPFEKLWRR
jgi:hypothetical protein